MSELSPDSRAVLEAGRDGDEPTDADRARLRSSLMRAMGAGALGAAGVLGAKALAGNAGAAGGALASGGAAAAGATVKGALVAKGTALATASTGAALSGKLIVAVVLAGALGGGFAIGRFAGPPASSPAAQEAPAEVKAGGSNKNQNGNAVVAAPGNTSEPAPEPPSGPAEEAPAKIEPRGAAPQSEGSLEVETKRLREVHAALQSGDPDAALKILEEGAGQDKGELREERTAARILALCKLGRTSEAADLAARFVKESPQSPLVDRVRGGCPAARPAGKPAAAAPAPAPSTTAAPPPVAPESAPPFDIND